MMQLGSERMPDGLLASGVLDRALTAIEVVTGAVLAPPAYLPIDVFPVRRAEGAVWTRDDR